MPAARRIAPLRRTLGVIALAYALVLQALVGGYFGGLHAAPLASAGGAPICAPDAKGSASHAPAQQHEGAQPCCLLGCATTVLLGCPERSGVTVRFPAVRPITFQDPSAAGRSLNERGDRNARAPPGIA